MGPAGHELGLVGGERGHGVGLGGVAGGPIAECLGQAGRKVSEGKLDAAAGVGFREERGAMAMWARACSAFGGISRLMPKAARARFVARVRPSATRLAVLGQLVIFKVSRTASIPTTTPTIGRAPAQSRRWQAVWPEGEHCRRRVA